MFILGCSVQDAYFARTQARTHARAYTHSRARAHTRTHARTHAHTHADTNTYTQTVDDTRNEAWPSHLAAWRYKLRVELVDAREQLLHSSRQLSVLGKAAGAMLVVRCPKRLGPTMRCADDSC